MSQYVSFSNEELNLLQAILHRWMVDFDDSDDIKFLLQKVAGYNGVSITVMPEGVKRT